MKFMMIIQIVAAIFLKGSKVHLIKLISLMQIMVYFPIYRVDAPANLQIFLKALRRIAEFKIFDEQVLYELFNIQNPFKDTNIDKEKSLK